MWGSYPLCRNLFKCIHFGVRFSSISSRVIPSQIRCLKNRWLHTTTSFRIPISKRSGNGNSDIDRKTFDQEENSDLYYKEVIAELYPPGSRQQLIMVQPRTRSGPNRTSQLFAESQLAESVALVETLPNWNIVEKHIFKSHEFESSMILKKTGIDIIKQLINENKNISGVFINIEIMSCYQKCELEEIFGVKVYDRYGIILQIFHVHAYSKEAKLQLSLAEIPYLRIRLYQCLYFPHKDVDMNCIEWPERMILKERKKMLKDRELILRKELEKLKEQRLNQRQNKKRKTFPVVAVVGYTNSGKTSLIKCLTGDNTLTAQNKLFATLDVTFHAGSLSSQKVLFVDTVGFISALPEPLVECFKATLEEIVHADLILHVRDMSNHSTDMQKTVVLETLEKIGVPPTLLESMIEVGNKIDLLERYPETNNETLLISATEGIGLEELAENIQSSIFKTEKHCVKVFRVSNGGEAYRWLYKEAAVNHAIADKNNPNYLYVEVIISPGTLGKFIHKYGDLSITIPHSA